MANQVFREKNRVSRRAGCFRNIVYLGWIIKTCEFEQKAQDKALNLYIDTRGAGPRPVTFTEAVVDGLAQGGGLYVPERIPSLSLEDILALADLPYAQRAARIYRAFDIDLPDEVVDALMAQAYGKNFDDERICPITSLTADTHVLELWHGPTSAFKDMALQCLPRFFSASAAQLREQIDGSPMLSVMIKRGRLKVVALYPDEDLAEWREYRGHIPPSWINGYDAGCVVREKSLYDLHAIPTLYLLDRDKRVLVKDSTDVPYIEEVIDRRG